MAIYHLAMKALARSAGRSATSGAAYRAAEVIYDIRTGKNHDYSRKRGVESARLLFPSARSPESKPTTPAPKGAGKREVGNTTTLPAAPLQPNLEQIRVTAGNSLQNLSQRRLASDPRKTRGNATGVLSLDVFPDRRPDVGLRRQSNGPRESRADFWNRVELHHKRGDATTCREVEIALPKELNRPQRKALAEAFGQVMADHYGVAADVSCHNPSNNNQNPHAHILLSACSVDSAGKLGKKVESLDPIQCAKRKQENAADIWRPVWEQMCNKALSEAGHNVRIDHRTLEAQGISDRNPGVHLGPKVIAFEQRENCESERRQKIQRRQESARLYQLDEERKTRAEDEQCQETLRHKLFCIALESAQADLFDARKYVDQVREEKRAFEAMRQQKTRLEAENRKLQQLQQELIVPTVNALLPGLRKQAKAEIDEVERRKGKPAPFEQTDLRKLSLTERLRKMRDEGRPAGFMSWLVGSGKAWDQKFFEIERQLGRVLVDESKLNQWFNRHHEPRVQMQAAATISAAGSRKNEIDSTISKNSARISDFEVRIPQVSAKLHATQAKATATLRLAEAKLDIVQAQGQAMAGRLIDEAAKSKKKAEKTGDFSELIKAMMKQSQADATKLLSLQDAAREKAEQSRQVAGARACSVLSGPR